MLAGKSLSSALLNIACEILRCGLVVLEILPVLDLAETGANVCAKLSLQIIPFLQQAKTLANDFACSLIHSRFHFMVDERLEFARKGNVHNLIITKSVKFGYLGNS